MAILEREDLNELTVLGLAEGFDIYVAVHDKSLSGGQFGAGLAAGLEERGGTSDGQGEAKRIAGVHKFVELDDAGF